MAQYQPGRTNSQNPPRCITCGVELHPERARKYSYCMSKECQEKNARGLAMVAVGMNKAAEEFLILDEDTQADLASGKYRDQRRTSFGTSAGAPPRPAGENGTGAAAEPPAVPPGRSAPASRAGRSGQPRPGPGGQPRPGPSGQPRPAPSSQPRPGPSGQPRPGPSGQPRPGPGGQARPAPSRPAPRPVRAPARPWTPKQERLALLYNEQGLRPAEIAQKLGVSSYLVTQIILAAKNRGKL
jgi:hypothetical protein